MALELLCREVLKKTRLFNFPARGPDAEKVMLTMLLSPPVAHSLAALGYSKADVQHYIFDNATFEIPQGPICSFRGPGGHRIALYELTRPEVIASFAGRRDF